MNTLIKLSGIAACLLTLLTPRTYGIIQLSNLSLEDSTGQLLIGSTWAQAFTTGTEGANIKTATIHIGEALFPGTATVSIFANGTSAPLNNGSLGSFTDITPGVISTAGDYSWASFAGIDLAPNTQYWIAVEGNGSFNLRWGFRNKIPPVVTTAQPGWDLVEDRSSSSDAGANWNDFTFNNGQFVFALDSEVIPEPHHTAALIGGALLFGAYGMRQRKIKRRARATAITCGEASCG